MIRNKADLNSYLDLEYANYFHRSRGGIKNHIKNLYFLITRDRSYQLYSYVKYLRYCELYKNSGNIIAYAICKRRKNIIGERFGLEIEENSIGKGLVIYHGNVIVHNRAFIGENCQFHGMNCIGNDGLNNECPSLGNNVELGIGSSILGGIYIADNTIVAANATVLNSIDEPSHTVGGTPAKILK